VADNLKFVAAGRKTLASSITTSSTTISLSDLNSRDGTALTMTDFGDIGFATLDPAGSTMELVSFTGISSASLTGVTRGLGFEAPYTNVAALQKAHAAGSKLVFSNSPQFYNEFGGKDNDETITGVWTFTSTALPTLDSYAAPTTDEQLASKKYVDDVAAGGSASIDRIVVDATAGATIAAGELIYHDATANEWLLCDADTATTVDNVLLGISQGAGTDGVIITGGVLLSGLDSNQTGMVEGDIMYAGNTAGAIASSAGTTEVTVGISRNATELYFAPRYNQNITEVQQDDLDTVSGSSTGSVYYSNGAALQELGVGTANQVLRVNTGATAPEWAVVAKFGGTGADGVLAVTSGTTTLDASGAAVLEKNYSSIAIDAGTTLTISNPNAAGTVLILKSTGNVTIEGTIDLDDMGAASTTNTGLALDDVDHAGDDGANGSGGAGGAGGTDGDIYTNLFYYVTPDASRLHRRLIAVVPGAGGGAGGNGQGGAAGGAGGRGGGALLLECAGAIDFDVGGVITVDGAIGTNGATGSGGADGGAGGGGGGAAGMALVLYNTLTDNSGTLSAIGGVGGAGGDANAAGGGGGGGGGAGGGAYSAAGSAAGIGGGTGNGVAGTATTTGAGAGGGGGGGANGATYTGGAGGTAGSIDTNHTLIAENTLFL
jgi:hypothetical protein